MNDPVDSPAVKLGALEIYVASDGEFRLDGGAMFGVVPKVLWERVKPPDMRNRIRMATNCLLVVAGSELLLVDAGLGDKHDDRFRDLFGLDEEATRLPESLRRLGFAPEDVTHVLLTHLHFDHCGWNTREQGSRLVPTFSRARYWLRRGEVEHARRPNERDRASYDPRNWEPLFDAGVVEVFDDGAEPLPGVRAIRAPGHNADMCIVLIESESETAVFWADLVPTSAHVAYPWIMSYDLFPMQTLETKRLWLPRAAREGWLCVFEHDADMPLGRIVEAGPDRYRAESVAARRPPVAAGAVGGG